MIEVEETFIGGPLPLVWQATHGQDASIAIVMGWLQEHKSLLVAARDRYGAVLLRGFKSIESAKHFDAILGILAPELMDYTGGTAPRHAVYGRVFTSSELPENYTLALHQEMAYQADRPDSLALFCEIPPEEGGETPVADARIVTARIDPAVRARFDAKGVGVRRTLPDSRSEHIKDGIPKPWAEVFGTTNRVEVERIARQKGWSISWATDASVQLWQQMLPAFTTHPRTGERVWCNQVHYHAPECMLRWALRDRRLGDAARIRRLMAEQPELLDHVFHGDDMPVSGEDAEHIWDVLVESEIPMQWKQGDVLLLDNILAMHGRRSFRGERRILVGLIRERSQGEK